jgi:hypothetical protein
MNKDEMKERSVDFLLKEYETLQQLIAIEDQQCEKRVTFFLTLAGGSIGIFGYFVRQQPQSGVVQSYPAELYYGSIALLTILLLFGVLTLNRLNARWIYRRMYTDRLMKINKYVVGDDEALGNLLATREKPKKGDLLRDRIRGTLTEFMLFSNSLVVGGLVAVISYHCQDGIVNCFVITWTLTAIAISFPLFLSYAEWMRHEPLSIEKLWRVFRK